MAENAPQMARPHLDEYDGTSYITPSLIDHDDGKENDTSGLVQGG